MAASSSTVSEEVEAKKLRIVKNVALTLMSALQIRREKAKKGSFWDKVRNTDTSLKTKFSKSTSVIHDGELTYATQIHNATNMEDLKKAIQACAEGSKGDRGTLLNMLMGLVTESYKIESKTHDNFLEKCCEEFGVDQGYAIAVALLYKITTEAINTKKLTDAANHEGSRTEMSELYNALVAARDAEPEHKTINIGLMTVAIVGYIAKNYKVLDGKIFGRGTFANIFLALNQFYPEVLRLATYVRDTLRVDATMPTIKIIDAGPSSSPPTP